MHIKTVGWSCFFITLMISINGVAAQEAIDTLKVHKDDFQLIRRSKDKCFYIRNNRINIECPDDYSAYISKKVLNSNTPYYLKLYYDKGFNNLYSEGIAYQYCFTGNYRQYYPDGRLQKEGKFKTVKSDSGIHNHCNHKTGQWHFYDSTGKKKRTETWAGGQFTGGRTWGYLKPWNIVVTVNGHPYRGEKLEVAAFESFDIKLYTKDHHKDYGRYELSLLVTGGKTPVTKQRLDYTILKYFDLQKFLNEYWKAGSDLHVTVEDTRTGVYFDTTFELKE